MIRPGPERIRPWTSPGGIVVHVYAVPAQTLLSVACIPADADMELLGSVADCQLYASRNFEAVCVVTYDGDTGDRLLSPGYFPGERL